MMGEQHVLNIGQIHTSGGPWSNHLLNNGSMAVGLSAVMFASWGVQATLQK